MTNNQSVSACCWAGLIRESAYPKSNRPDMYMQFRCKTCWDVCEIIDTPTQPEPQQEEWNWEDKFDEFSTGKTWEADGMVILATPAEVKEFIFDALARQKAEMEKKYGKEKKKMMLLIAGDKPLNNGDVWITVEDYNKQIAEAEDKLFNFLKIDELRWNYGTIINRYLKERYKEYYAEFKKSKENDEKI
jgi:hypothetical protein